MFRSRAKFLRSLLELFLPYTSGAWAQAASGAEYIGATELRANMAGAGQAKARLVGKLLGGGDTYRYLMIRRDRTSQVQAHAAWDEILLVKDGDSAGRRGMRAENSNPYRWHPPQ